MTDRVIVEHEDGRRFSVPNDDPRATGHEKGWTVEGAETDAHFVVSGIPKPRKGRRPPRVKATAAAQVVEPESEPE